MFSRRERLSRDAFPQGGRTPQFSSDHFRVVTLPGRGYAIVVSKKVLKRAVDRHRLKRRIAGALSHPPPLPLPPAAIIYPRASATTLSGGEMRAELAALFSQSC